MIDLSHLKKGALVTVDTAPIIYLLEENPDHLNEYLPLFEKIDAGELHAVISVITLSEIIAGPLRHNNEIIADRYYQALTTQANWRVQNMDAELSFTAARIRASYKLKLPDAIQVATTIHSNSSALVTHDRDFYSVNEIEILGI